MDTLLVTTSSKWADAEVKASVFSDGEVKIWYYYPEIGQERHEIVLTGAEWDQLAAWVQWQRSKNAVSNEGSV
jgi:hypothetical protein